MAGDSRNSDKRDRRSTGSGPRLSQADVLAIMESTLDLVRQYIGPENIQVGQDGQMWIGLPVSVRFCGNCQHLRIGACDCAP